MRKPINNETQLINEIWNGKLLNERRQSTEPSIYDPRMTNIMTDPATSAINRFLPWADRLSKAAKGYKPRETSETEGPTVSISDEDLDSGEIPEIAMEPIIKKIPEFPGWGDGPHGYDPTTPEDAKGAEQWRNRYNSALNYAKSRGLSVADASKHAERVASGQWPGDQKGITPELAQSMKGMGFTPDQIPQAVIPGDEQQQRFNQILTQMERNWLTRQDAAATATQKLADRIADPTGMKAQQGEMSRVSPVAGEQPMDAAVAMKKLADRIADPTGMKARLKAQQGEMSKVSPVGSEQPMDKAVEDWMETRANMPAKEPEQKPATELGGIEGFAPALSASEFEELGMGVSKPSTAAPAAKPEKYSGPYSQRAPEADTPVTPAPAATKKTDSKNTKSTGQYFYPDTFVGREKTKEEVKPSKPQPSKKLPEQPMDAAVAQDKNAKALGWKSGNEQTVAVDKLQAKLDVAIKGLEDLQRMKDARTGATAKSTASQPTGGQSSQNIVPGSVMWSQASDEEKRRIRDQYSRGDTSLSIKYDSNTGKFSQPGYAPGTGQYADIVTALNAMNESVNYYCRFITETTEPKKATKRATKKAKEDKAKPDLFGTSASSESTPVSSTTTPAVVVAPVRPVPSGEAFSRKPVHGGRPEAKRLVSTTTTVPATALVTPSASKPTETISGARQLGRTVKRVATSPQMTGGLAGGIAGSLLATIISITSGSGQQARTSSVVGADQMQPKSVNTQNTPTTGGGHSLEIPPETNQSQKPLRWPTKK